MSVFDGAYQAKRAAFAAQLEELVVDLMAAAVLGRVVGLVAFPVELDEMADTASGWAAILQSGAPFDG